MQTREKLGAQAKKMLKILQDQKDQIIDGYKIILTCRDFVLPDIKKLIELLFIFEGLGFITRISKKRYIYSGLKGMTMRILEGIEQALTRTSYDREHWLFSDDYIVENKRYSIRQSVYFGLFYQEILTQIFISQNRIIARDQIEKLLETLQLAAKDQSSALLFNEMASIMTGLNLLDKRSSADTYETYQWIGPDIIHQFSFESLNPYSLELKDQLFKKNKLTFEKEHTYYTNLFRDLLDVQVQATEEFDQKFPMINFPTASYALLKGKHITYYMKKLTAIIGRSNSMRNSKFQWEVDLALDNGPKISKQHAIITYNIDKENFEIRCLSAKKPILVDSVQLNQQDNPLPLKHRSTIQIGKYNFQFYLPKFINEQNNQETNEQNMTVE